MVKPAANGLKEESFPEIYWRGSLHNDSPLVIPNSIYTHPMSDTSTTTTKHFVKSRPNKYYLNSSTDKRDEKLDSIDYPSRMRLLEQLFLKSKV